MCSRYVGLSGRRSTMMSRIAPRVARTSFISAAGGNWQCIPRSVPLRFVKARLAGAAQRLELIDPAVARPFEVFDLEPDVLVGLVQLPRAFARIPFGSERRQDPRDLAEVRAVIAQVRSRALGEGDLAAGHSLVHDLGYLAYAVVLVVAADVEGFPAHKVFRRRQHGEERARDVLD